MLKFRSLIRLLHINNMSLGNLAEDIPSASARTIYSPDGGKIDIYRKSRNE
jgi:hypothetical protein